MKHAVMGTGMVGETIASKLVALGHEVMMGSRSKDNEKAVAWVKKVGGKASQGTFADAAAFAEVVWNCTNGEGSIPALTAAGKQNLEGKLLLDISNPLDFSKGMPPMLFTPSNDSLGERIQREFPGAKVVKTLNTVNCNVMVDPGRIKGDHDVFVSGNDAQAKAQATKILREELGWKSVVDLGDITTARGPEQYLMLWLRLWGAVGSPDFNIKIVR